MINKYIFVWYLLQYLRFETYAEHSSQYPQELSDNIQCVFDVPHETYNITDLIRCMNKIAIEFFVENDDQSLIAKQTSQIDPSPDKENYLEYPYGNMILNLFDNAQILSQYFPLNLTAGNYQLNTLNDNPNQFGRFGTNIFNALLSISRHDDLKCVSRILCEIASGKPPREYKQTSTRDNQRYLKRKNTFTQFTFPWLNALGEISPILSLARGISLGYNNNGNPAVCYYNFPKCPRNPKRLLHYLNNHNGGFFRFFNQTEYGNYAQSSYSSQDNSKFFKEKQRKAPPPGIAGPEADRTGTGKLKIDVSVLTDRQDYRTNFFPEKNILSPKQVVFPNREESSDYSLNKNIFQSLSDSPNPDVNKPSKESPPVVFPQESEHQKSVLYFISKPDSVFYNKFQFPH